MKTLVADISLKTKELLAYNDVEPVYTFGSQDENSLDNIMKKQQALLNEIEALAKANNTLLGREIRFPMADSYAFYIITKINKKTVEITWIRYCDAWVDDRAGYCANLDINYAMKQVKGRDAIEEMFAKRNVQ